MRSSEELSEEVEEEESHWRGRSVLRRWLRRRRRLGNPGAHTTTTTTVPPHPLASPPHLHIMSTSQKTRYTTDSHTLKKILYCTLLTPKASFFFSFYSLVKALFFTHTYKFFYSQPQPTHTPYFITQTPLIIKLALQSLLKPTSLNSHTAISDL